PGSVLKPGGAARAHRLDRRRPALDRLTVARVGHAFAPPAMGSVGEFRHDDDRLGPGAAADGEGAGDRPALDTHGKGEGVHWRRIIRYRDMLFRPQSKWRASVWTMRSAKNHTAVYAAIAFCIIAAAGATGARAQTAARDNSSIYSYAGADREQRLIAKAREERTLTLYTSMATTESTPLAHAFEAKYGIKVQLWRALSENVMQRALTEARSGRHGMDAVETNAPEVEALAREDVLAPYNSPYLADLPHWAIPPHRRRVPPRTRLRG